MEIFHQTRLMIFSIQWARDRSVVDQMISWDHRLNSHHKRPHRWTHSIKHINTLQCNHFMLILVCHTIRLLVNGRAIQMVNKKLKIEFLKILKAFQPMSSYQPSSMGATNSSDSLRGGMRTSAQDIATPPPFGTVPNLSPHTYPSGVAQVWLWTIIYYNLCSNTITNMTYLVM